MAINTLDLSALDQVSLDNEKELVIENTPRWFTFEELEEDPDQPRKIFDPVKIAMMVEDVKIRGVKSPVSVRENPNKAGKFLLNHGALRYRSSKLAETGGVPGFIDNDYNDYDQVKENFIRFSLTPMELAIFINKKIKEGHKKSFIAKALNFDASAITHYLSMIDLPDCLEQLYRTNKTTSPKTLYELRKIYDKNPEHVENWTSTVEEVGRRDVNFLKAQLVTKSVESEIEIEEPQVFDVSEKNEDNIETVLEGVVKGKPKKTTLASTSSDDDIDLGHDQENGSHESIDLGEAEPKENTGKKSKLAKSIEIVTPSIIVSYDNKDAVLILTHKPKSKDKVFIYFLSPKHGLDMLEVDPQDLKIKSLSDSAK